jgi:hypothetical protein
MRFPFAPDKYSTSGPKGLKDATCDAGDKSPAYPEVSFSAAYKVVP